MKSRELLERAYGDDDLLGEDIDALLVATPSEDAFLDYKSGRELQDSKKAAKTLRKYIAAFSNSAGGTIVFGVHEKPLEVDGCPANADWAAWAARSLEPIAANLHAPPRIHVIAHANGAVLLVSVLRGDNLVPVVEAGELCFWLRLGDSTTQAPEYLVGDLLTGRRAKPNLTAMATVRDELDARNGDVSALTLRVSIANSSLVSAADVSFAALFWGPQHTWYGLEAPAFLHSWLGLDRTAVPRSSNLRQYAVPTGHSLVQPGQAMAPTLFALGVQAFEERTEVGCACYLTGRDCPPTWYQLRAELWTAGGRGYGKLVEFSRCRERVKIYQRRL